MALGALGVLGLALGVGLTGNAWPGLVVLGGLGLAMLGLTPRVGRRFTRLDLSIHGWSINGAPPQAYPQTVQLDGPWLVADGTKIPLHGEEEPTREALRAYLEATGSY